MTLQNQIAWFHFVATKQKLSLQTRGVYQYILELSLVSGNGDIVISQDEMTAALATSKSVVNRSLKELDTFGIIGMKRGRISLTPPPTSWLEKYSKRFNSTVIDTETDTSADTDKSLRIIARGRKKAAGVSALPLQGKDYTPETSTSEPRKSLPPLKPARTADESVSVDQKTTTTAAQILASLSPDELRILKQKDDKVQRDWLERKAWLQDHPNETPVSYNAYKQGREMTGIEKQLHQQLIFARGREEYKEKQEAAQQAQIQSAKAAGMKIS